MGLKRTSILLAVLYLLWSTFITGEQNYLIKKCNGNGLVSCNYIIITTETIFTALALMVVKAVLHIGCNDGKCNIRRIFYLNVGHDSITITQNAVLQHIIKVNLHCYGF